MEKKFGNPLEKVSDAFQSDQITKQQKRKTKAATHFDERAATLEKVSDLFKNFHNSYSNLPQPDATQDLSDVLSTKQLQDLQKSIDTFLKGIKELNDDPEFPTSAKDDLRQFPDRQLKHLKKAYEKMEKAKNKSENDSRAKFGEGAKWFIERMEAFLERVDNQSANNLVPVLKRSIESLANNMETEDNEKLSLDKLGEWFHDASDKIKDMIDQRSAKALQFKSEIEKIVTSIKDNWQQNEGILNEAFSQDFKENLVSLGKKLDERPYTKGDFQMIIPEYIPQRASEDIKVISEVKEQIETYLKRKSQFDQGVTDLKKTLSSAEADCDKLHKPIKALFDAQNKFKTLQSQMSRGDLQKMYDEIYELKDAVEKLDLKSLRFSGVTFTSICDQYIEYIGNEKEKMESHYHHIQEFKHNHTSENTINDIENYHVKIERKFQDIIDSDHRVPNAIKVEMDKLLTDIMEPLENEIDEITYKTTTDQTWQMLIKIHKLLKDIDQPYTDATALKKSFEDFTIDRMEEINKEKNEIKERANWLISHKSGTTLEAIQKMENYSTTMAESLRSMQNADNPSREGLKKSLEDLWKDYLIPYLQDKLHSWSQTGAAKFQNKVFYEGYMCKPGKEESSYTISKSNEIFYQVHKKKLLKLDSSKGALENKVGSLVQGLLMIRQALGDLQVRYPKMAREEPATVEGLMTLRYILMKPNEEECLRIIKEV